MWSQGRGWEDQSGRALLGAQALAAYKLIGDRFILKPPYGNTSAFQLKISPIVSFLT